MKIQHLLFLLLVVTVLLSCRQKEAGQSEQEVAAGLTQADRDSLYQHYLAEKPNEYPVDAILEKGKLYPEDQAVLDSSFLIYRGQLLDAVRGKDLLALLPLLDQNIQCSFGDDQGKAGLARLWGLDKPDQIENSAMWAEMESVLTRGGAFEQGGMFTAPYVYANWPGTYDAFDYGLIEGRMVRMRAAPNLGAGIVTNLTHDIVRVLDTQGPEETIGGETYRWVQLETLDGKKGYVWGKFVSQSIYYRAGFEQKEGDWKMTFFLAGD